MTHTCPIYDTYMSHVWHIRTINVWLHAAVYMTCMQHLRQHICCHIWDMYGNYLEHGCLQAAIHGTLAHKQSIYVRYVRRKWHLRHMYVTLMEHLCFILHGVRWIERLDIINSACADRQWCTMYLWRLQLSSINDHLFKAVVLQH